MVLSGFASSADVGVLGASTSVELIETGFEYHLNVGSCVA
jgi:hypothetical protein